MFRLDKSTRHLRHSFIAGRLRQAPDFQKFNNTSIESLTHIHVFRPSQPTPAHLLISARPKESFTTRLPRWSLRIQAQFSCYRCASRRAPGSVAVRRAFLGLKNCRFHSGQPYFHKNPIEKQETGLLQGDAGVKQVERAPGKELIKMSTKF